MNLHSQFYEISSTWLKLWNRHKLFLVKTRKVKMWLFTQFHGKEMETWVGSHPDTDIGVPQDQLLVGATVKGRWKQKLGGSHTWIEMAWERTRQVYETLCEQIHLSTSCLKTQQDRKKRQLAPNSGKEGGRLHNVKEKLLGCGSEVLSQRRESLTWNWRKHISRELLILRNQYVNISKTSKRKLHHLMITSSEIQRWAQNWAKNWMYSHKKKKSPVLDFSPRVGIWGPVSRSRADDGSPTWPIAYTFPPSPRSPKPPCPSNLPTRFCVRHLELANLLLGLASPPSQTFLMLHVCTHTTHPHTLCTQECTPVVRIALGF